MSQSEDHLAPRAHQRNRVVPASSIDGSMAARAEPLPAEARTFEPVDGLPELSVTALRRAGFEKLLTSQKIVLRFLKVTKGLQINYNKVIVSGTGTGKTTLLCLAGFAVIMRSSTSDSLAPTTEHSSLDAGTLFFTPLSRDLSNTSPSSSAITPLVLVVVASHENARQAGAFLDLLLSFHGSSCATFIGDVPEFTALSKWPAAVVCTLGSLLDLIEHRRLNLSEILYLAIDDFDTFLQTDSFVSSLQILHERLPECQVVVTSSSMTQDLVAPIMTLIKPTSPIPAIVTMKNSVANRKEMTDVELVDEFRRFLQAQ